MSDLIAVALITGAVALIPQAFLFWQTGRQARQADRDRRAASARRACEGLYTTVSDLRTQIRTNYDYHGSEMRARLEKVWRYAGDADKQAVRIELLVPVGLAESARQLAESAAKAAVAAAANTNLDMGTCVALPDLTDLAARAAAFREQVSAYMGA
jgi:hypothetical protein